MHTAQLGFWRILAAGDQDEVHVVGQAPRQDVGSGRRHVLVRQLKVGSAITGGEEHALAVSPTLSGVISHFWDETASVSGRSEETVDARGQSSLKCQSAPSVGRFRQQLS